MRLPSHVSITDTDDGVVLLQQRTGRYFQLNHTGGRVLRRLLDGGTLGGGRGRVGRRLRHRDRTSRARRQRRDRATAHRGSGGGPVSVSMALAERHRIPLRSRLLPLLAVGVARLLCHLKPAGLRAVLEFVRRGGDPATARQALAAREARSCRSACAVPDKTACSAPSPRRVLCRTRGVWPTWCTGVRTHPFAAHAWVEVAGQPIGEPHPKGYYKPMLTVRAVTEPSQEEATG